MKELDDLLLGYLEQCYDDAPEAEQRAFSELLEYPDPDLWSYFNGRKRPPEAALSELIDRIAAVKRRT